MMQHQHTIVQTDAQIFSDVEVHAFVPVVVACDYESHSVNYVLRDVTQLVEAIHKFSTLSSNSIKFRTFDHTRTRIDITKAYLIHVMRQFHVREAALLCGRTAL